MLKPSIQLHETFQQSYLCNEITYACSPPRHNLFSKSITMLFGGGERNTLK